MPITCEDANESLKTDKECDTYKKGCLTTGQGCTSEKKTCD